MSRLRVLVVEDSLTIRRMLCDLLTSHPEFEVVGEAADGKRAIELCGALRPDVVSLDMILAGMSGLVATEHIMAHFPTPILIVSASTNRSELFQTYQALAAGAVDVLEKPRGDAFDDAWEARFVTALKLVARIKVITHPRARLGMLGRTSEEPSSTVALATNRTYSAPLIAIGASTGGPGAIVEVLRALPTGLGAPILIVMHIDEPFSSSFAEWLDAQTPHHLRKALDGEPLSALTTSVVMAPAGLHLMVRAGRLHLSSAPPRHSCRPSVDVLFESLAGELGSAVTACLLTGMGRDGAAGLLAIRRAGGSTIAQDEATSVVYGMPREAALLNAAERILPLPQIGPALGQLLSLDGRSPNRAR
jgi:two-component system chemotaxis response regulator CheB